MTTQTLPPRGSQGGTVTVPPPPPRFSLRSMGILITPAAVLLVVGGLLVYVRNASLDEIEGRLLTLDYLWSRTWEHLKLAAVSSALVLVVALPLGVLLTRRAARAATPIVIALANLGQSAPAIGVVVLLAVVFRIGFWTAVLALALYSALPALRNTMIGLQQVDPTLIDAGRGIGMSHLAVLGKVEIPLAAPVILAGVRITLVLNVGVASIAAFIGGGGLGDLIVNGVTLQRDLVLVTGSVLIAAVALLIDWLGDVVGQVLEPKGL